MPVGSQLIGEGARVEATVEGVPLTVEKIYRADAGDQDAGQPRTWTFTEFEVPDDQSEALAASAQQHP